MHMNIIYRVVAGALLFVAISASAHPLSLDEVQILLASDGVDRDLFGSSVAVDGEFAVVGANGVDGGSDDEGAAYVYRRTPTGWIEHATLAASDAGSGDSFGFSVAISGDTVLVGAHRNSNATFNDGAAYVFVRNGGSWVQQDKLVANDPGNRDFLGLYVALDGDTALVSATHDDDNGSESGSAYVFVRSGDTWSQQQKLLPPDGVATDRFSNSLDISGDTVVIGSRNDVFPNQDGAAYVFVRSGSAWSLETQLSPVDQGSRDGFGNSVAVDGDTIAIVSPSHQHAGEMFTSSVVYLYTRSGSLWTEEVEFRADGQVDLDGDRLIVNDFLFERRGRQWIPHGRFALADSTNIVVSSGAIDGNTVLLSDRLYPGDVTNFGSGGAWVFSVAMKALVPIPDINSSGTPEAGVLRLDASNDTYVLDIRDGDTDELLNSINFGKDRAFDIAVLADIDSSGNPEIGVLNQQAAGDIRVQIRDSVSGNIVSNLWYQNQHQPVSMAVVPDYNGSGFPEVAVLGSEAGTDAVRVQIRESSNNAFVDNIFLGTQSIAMDLVSLNDTSGNGIPEMGILGVLKGNNQVRSQIWDADTATFQSNVWFGNVYQPHSMTTMPDINMNGSDEIVALGVDPATQNIRVQVRDSDTTATFYNIWLGAVNEAVDIKLINDINSDGVSDLAVLLKTPDGTGRVRVQSGANGAFIRNLFYSVVENPVGLAVMPDYSGNGFEELAVLGESAGVRHVQILDTSSGSQVNRIDFP
jgi:hypothetical protein